MNRKPEHEYHEEIQRLIEENNRVRRLWHLAQNRVNEFGGYRFDLWCALDNLLRNPDEEEAKENARRVLAATQKNKPDSPA